MKTTTKVEEFPEIVIISKSVSTPKRLWCSSPSSSSTTIAPIPTYAYNYAVLIAESGNNFSTEEEAKHGAVAEQYKVLRADGKIMTVSYTVERDSGFVADVVTELPPPPAYVVPPAPLPSYA
nr:uncharacterized protein LOC121131264 [Lepeophtheirus salmonis]